MRKNEYCVGCDTTLTPKEATNVSGLMRKHHLIVCSKCLPSYKEDIKTLYERHSDEEVQAEKDFSL